MSIVICNGCDAWVDSDHDMDCFVGAYEPKRFKCVPDSDHVLCEWCRDAYPEDDGEENSVAGLSVDGAPSLQRTFSENPLLKEG